MEKEFIPYEQALALKELGFDEPCFALYVKEEKIRSKEFLIKISCSNQRLLEKKSTTAPLYQQAFRWFREKHQMQYRIVSIKHFGKLTFYWDVFSTCEITSVLYNKTSKTYEEAELECLKQLIEIVKNG
jgi:hypothetical protein